MTEQEKEIQEMRKRLLRQLRTASSRYGLIADGDRILVGLSGGKDSLCLLELLAWQSRVLKPSFQVEALHIRMEGVSYETDLGYLEDFCSRLCMPFHVLTASITATAAPQHHREKPICFLCSWNRRKQLFRFAQDHGFNKIALGHHQDDIIDTALMNLCFQGQFSTMPARLEMRKMPLTIIRPLCAIREADIQCYAQASHFQPLVKRCPHEHATQRTRSRLLFHEFEQMNPEARYSIWNALEAAGKLTEASATT